MNPRKAVPKPVRVALHPITLAVRTPALLWQLRRLAENPDRLPTLREARRLFIKWSNGEAPAYPEVLVEVARLCRDAEGPVLECGSGVTTFLAAIYARHGCWSLEDSDAYRRRVVEILERANLDGSVIRAPLVEHGDFDWYDVPDGVLPERFAAVICDGPVGTTRGGRSGLLPCLVDRLGGAEVILDDADRESEREVIDLWRTEFGVEQTGSTGGAALLRVPERVA